MFSRQSGGVRCLALLAFTVLPLVACAGSSTNVDVHVVSETATDSRSYFPVRPCERWAAGPVKQRVAAHRRALYGCVPAILAAVVIALLVVRCAWVAGVRTNPKRHGRFLAEGGNKDVLGVCEATLGGADAEGPSEGSDGKTAASLEERVSRVLAAIDELTAFVATRYSTVPELQGSLMVTTIQGFAILELGALAGLVEGALEQKRKKTTEKVLDLSHNALQVRRARHLRPSRMRIRDHLQMLKAIRISDFPGPALEPADRLATVETLAQVQEKLLEMVKTLLEKLASFQAPATPWVKVPPIGPHKVLGKLFHARKMHLLKDPLFRNKFMHFQEGTKSLRFADPRKDVGGPPPPTSEQIQELQAVIMQAQLLETQEHQPASNPPPGPPDPSVTPQQSGDGSTSSPQPHHGSVQQAALSLQSLSIRQSPGPGLFPPRGSVRPPPGFPPRSSFSPHQQSHPLSQRLLPPSPHPVPAPAAPRQPLSATATPFFPGIRPAPGATLGHALRPPAPSPFTSSLRPSPRFPSSPQHVLPGPASSALSPHARPFFPLTASSAPGAHRTQHLFHGDPHGMPPASGYPADSGEPPEVSQESQPDSKGQT